MLTLYHHGSSACAAKVRFALAEKGLEWEGRYIDLMRGEQFAPDYVALNPKAVVPTLVDDGAVIPESSVICEYLEERFPDPALLPSDPVERAHVRIWTKAVDEELHPACSAVTYTVSHRHVIIRRGIDDFEAFLAAGPTEGRAARERKWQWIQLGLDAPGIASQVDVYAGYIRKMETALGDRDWLVGNTFTLADVAMAPYLFRLAVLAMDGIWAEGRLPGVANWYQRVRARPSFAAAFVAWMPDDLASEMRANGEREWPKVKSILQL